MQTMKRQCPNSGVQVKSNMTEISNNVNKTAGGYLEKSRVYKNFHYSVLTQNQVSYLHKRTLEMFKETVKLFD